MNIISYVTTVVIVLYNFRYFIHNRKAGGTSLGLALRFYIRDIFLILSIFRTLEYSLLCRCRSTTTAVSNLITSSDR